eukprot:5313808-Pyramimonas_sp.AAC.1
MAAEAPPWQSPWNALGGALWQRWGERLELPPGALGSPGTAWAGLGARGSAWERAEALPWLL